MVRANPKQAPLPLTCNLATPVPAFPPLAGNSLLYLSTSQVLIANANNESASFSSQACCFPLPPIINNNNNDNNNKIDSSDLPLPNLAQAASQPPVSTVYSSQLCAVLGACIRLASSPGGRASLHLFIVYRCHWAYHMRPTEQSSHRLGREACSTGARRSPAIDASKRVRTIACSGWLCRLCRHAAACWKSVFVFGCLQV